MLHAIKDIKERLAWEKRRAILGVAGLILLKIGAAFLVAAIWMIIAAEFSPVIATLACAAFFLVAGVGVMALRGARPKPEIPSPEERLHSAGKERARPAGKEHISEEYPALIKALLFGLSVYEQVRKERGPS